MEKDILCAICKKLVWKAPSNKYDDGVDNWVDGNVFLDISAKIKIDTDGDEFYWEINKFGNKVPRNGIGFCSEKCFEIWVKNVVIR